MKILFALLLVFTSAVATAADLEDCGFPIGLNNSLPLDVSNVSYYTLCMSHLGTETGYKSGEVIKACQTNTSPEFVTCVIDLAKAGFASLNSVSGCNQNSGSKFIKCAKDFKFQGYKSENAIKYCLKVK